MDGFGLFVVLVRDAALVATLKSKVIDWVGEPTAVADVSITEPQGFAAEALRETLSAVARPDVRLCWLEAHRGAGVPAWDQERGELLSRLNERRGRLEASFSAGMILLLPETGLRMAASSAPDLWHVRSLTVTLAAEWERPAYDVSAAELQLCVASAHRLAFGDSLTVFASPWLTRWLAIFGERTPSVQDLDDVRIFDLPIRDGAQEVQAALAGGHLTVASAVAERLVQLTDLRRANVEPGRFTIGITHDECLAALARADTLAAQGHWQAALTEHLRAEAAARSHAQQLGTESVGAMVLEAAMDPLWFAAARLREWSIAERAVNEVASLRRRDLTARGDGPAQRALSASLVGWAHIKAMQGDFAAAESVLGPALSLLTGTEASVWDAPANAWVSSLVWITLARLRMKQGDPTSAGLLLGEVMATAKSRLNAAPDPLDPEDIRLMSQWAALLPSAVGLLREQGDPSAAQEAARLAVQLSSSFMDRANRSSRALWLHWRSLATAKTVSPNPEFETQMASLTIEWSARFPELPASPDQADLLSSGIPVPGAQASRVPSSPTASSVQ